MTVGAAMSRMPVRLESGISQCSGSDPALPSVSRLELFASMSMAGEVRSVHLRNAESVTAFVQVLPPSCSASHLEVLPCP